jgi:ATP-dependent Clp protease adaptor protein ClpS
VEKISPSISTAFSGRIAGGEHMPRQSETEVLPVPDLETGSRIDEELNPDYHVIMHNDNVTPMDFVVHLLNTLFEHPIHLAVQLMLEVHHTGSAVVATLPLEVAELRCEQVHALARPRGYPLSCSIERA